MAVSRIGVIIRESPNEVEQTERLLENPQVAGRIDGVSEVRLNLNFHRGFGFELCSAIKVCRY